MAIVSYKDLIVWQRSMELAENIYSITKCFPPSELYGLTLQMRRAAVSIPSNIAEGYQRSTTKEYLHFLSIARGSAAELETQTLLAKNIFKNINFIKTEALLLETQKMLTILVKSLKNIANP